MIEMYFCLISVVSFQGYQFQRNIQLQFLPNEFEMEKKGTRMKSKFQNSLKTNVMSLMIMFLKVTLKSWKKSKKEQSSLFTDIEEKISHFYIQKNLIPMILIIDIKQAIYLYTCYP